MFSDDAEYGSSVDVVPSYISVVREHSTGCSSTDLERSVSGKACIDCSSYPYRDTTSPCEVKYRLTAVRHSKEADAVEVVFSGVNEVTGEALYRLLKSYWDNPWDVVLTLVSSKSGSLAVKRNPNKPSEAQKLKAKAIAKHRSQHG